MVKEALCIWNTKESMEKLMKIKCSFSFQKFTAMLDDKMTRVLC